MTMPSRDDTKSIGAATMDASGTITLQLRADDGAGARGDALFTYGPGHPEYRKILDHLGGLAPGQTKPVPLWKE